MHITRKGYDADHNLVHMNTFKCHTRKTDKSILENSAFVRMCIVVFSRFVCCSTDITFTREPVYKLFISYKRPARPANKHQLANISNETKRLLDHIAIGLLFGSINKTMYNFTLQIFTAAFLATTIVWSLPVGLHRRQTESLATATTFKVSKEAINQLTSITDASKGLLQLWKKARSLTKEAWLTTEVQTYSLMRMRIFHVCIVSTCGTQSMQRSHL